METRPQKNFSNFIPPKLFCSPFIYELPRNLASPIVTLFRLYAVTIKTKPELSEIPRFSKQVQALPRA